jgi:hypothetical protein
MSWSRLNQTVALLIFTVFSAHPLYSQETQALEKSQSVRTTSEPSEVLSQSSANSSAMTRNSQEVETRNGADQPSGQGYLFPTKRERFNRYVSRTVGPFSLLRTGLSAGIGQWQDHPEEWGQGASGYGKRYASGIGQNTIQQTVTYGLDEALGLDTGFEKSKRKGFFPRNEARAHREPNVTHQNRKESNFCAAGSWRLRGRNRFCRNLVPVPIQL